MLFFQRKKPPLIGLDISSTALKLLEFSKTSSLGRGSAQYRVESYAVEPLSANAVVEKSIADVEAVGDCIRNVVRRSGSKAKHVAVAVTGSAVITKIITMSASLSDAEMEAQIQLEADQYIPYALDEVNMDFDVLGATEKDPEMVDVLLAASRSENVDDRVAAIEIAGLTAEIVDVEAYAMENACTQVAEQLPNGGEGQTIAVADVGAATTTMNVLHNNKIIYTREQNFGGRQLTEEIQRRYGLSYEEAGMAKHQGGLPDNYVSEVLEPFREAMAQQVSRSLQFFFSSSPYNSVDYILMAGGCSSIPGVDELIEEKLETPAIIANPFANMSVSSRVKPQSLSNDAPSMMIACGLALRSFD
ncbi:Type IV pilus biogenesis protein PilM [hydrothermal vent metagenome]|uniref:Type IV pilus biogenesis protein PilM n=1 Tax=hydrothermal vent metagenome TaxID=652676 RepID=A0A3B1C0H9_9ZZZZ